MTTPTEASHRLYRFADLTLDVGRRRVTRGGQPIELKSLDFDLVRILVESAPNVVNADVLAEKVWGRHYVSPENVAQRVMLLRQSLDDDANRPRYIETVRNKGYRLIPVVERVQAVASAAAARRRWAVAALAASLLVAAGVLVPPPEQPPPSPTSIAVLPFENLSPNPDDAFFAAGTQDAIVGQLTKLRGFRVIPVRPDPKAPESIKEIVRSLDVATTLGGRVYYSDGRLQISARLTDAATGASLWARTFERERRDVFAIQTEIALEVARALSVELSLAERRRVERVPTANTQAFDYYLNARLRYARVSREETNLATDELHQALSLDPTFVDAWVLSSVIHTTAQFLDPEHLDEHRAAARHAAEQALALDPELPAAHNALAGSLMSTKEWVGAESALAEAMRLAPSLDVVSKRYAFLLMSAGKFEAAARDVLEQARAADHQTENPHRFLAFVHAQMGDWDRANAVYESALRLFANDDRAVRALQEQRMHWQVGRGDLDAAAATIRDPFNARMVTMLDAPRAEARAELHRAFETSVDGNPNHRLDIALWAGHFGAPQLALAAIRKVVDAQPAQMAYVWMPQLSEMRQLPKFKDFMRDINMVAYWQEYGWPEDFCWPLTEHDFECH